MDYQQLLLAVLLELCINLDGHDEISAANWTIDTLYDTFKVLPGDFWYFGAKSIHEQRIALEKMGVKRLDTFPVSGEPI